MESADQPSSQPSGRSRTWKRILGILGLETVALACFVLLSGLDPQPEIIAAIVAATTLLLMVVGILSNRIESRDPKK